MESGTRQGGGGECAFFYTELPHAIWNQHCLSWYFGNDCELVKIGIRQILEKILLKERRGPIIWLKMNPHAIRQLLVFEMIPQSHSDFPIRNRRTPILILWISIIERLDNQCPTASIKNLVVGKLLPCPWNDQGSWFLQVQAREQKGQWLRPTGDSSPGDFPARPTVLVCFKAIQPLSPGGGCTRRREDKLRGKPQNENCSWSYWGELITPRA